MGKLRRVLLVRGQAQRGALIIGVAVGLLALIFLALHFTLTDAEDARRAGSLAEIVLSCVTALAIVAGGIFAAYKWQIFRDFEPHLTITHEVSHRSIGDNYVHIDVTATLHNSSRVKMEFLKGFVRLQRIAPVSDEEVESLYAQVFVDKVYDDLQWPILDEAPLSWDRDELIIEPGERHQEAYEFIVAKAVRAVIIYTYFYNSRPSQPSRSSEGWGATTVHDIMDSE